jgi:hypothetical protein
MICRFIHQEHRMQHYSSTVKRQKIKELKRGITQKIIAFKTKLLLAMISKYTKFHADTLLICFNNGLQSCFRMMMTPQQS